ncbi:MAG: VWA domain-containing protein [Bryobacteraceae bacterium]|nr:VWA domain-containing protein [Bryobacteraceae bacterium]
MAALFHNFCLTALWLAQDDLVFRSRSAFISVDAQVLSNGQAIRGLRQEDFRIFDNGQPRPISSFGAEDQELDVLLLLDVSQSTGALQAAIQRSAAAAMGHLYPKDRVALMIFADEPFVQVPFTEDRALLSAKLAALPPGRGGTDLHAAVQSAAKYLQDHARPGARRAIVMLSDNRGYGSVNAPEVRNQLWAANAVFNLLLFPAQGPGRQADVREFVKATGGELLAFRPEGLPLAELFERLRRRYYLLYPAPPAKPGELRQIRVELLRRYPAAAVRARTGYVAAL